MYLCVPVTMKCMYTNRYKLQIQSYNIKGKNTFSNKIACCEGGGNLNHPHV